MPNPGRAGFQAAICSTTLQPSGWISVMALTWPSASPARKAAGGCGSCRRSSSPFTAPSRSRPGQPASAASVPAVRGRHRTVQRCPAALRGQLRLQCAAGPPHLQPPRFQRSQMPPSETAIAGSSPAQAARESLNSPCGYSYDARSLFWSFALFEASLRQGLSGSEVPNTVRLVQTIL